MPRYKMFRHLFPVIALSSMLLCVVSCSEGPTPGPISPINPATKNPQALSKIRPVLRKSDETAPGKPARHALAKGAYTDEQLLALINQQPALSTGELKTLLLSEAPLSGAVLKAVLDRDPKMSTGDLKAVLLASTPLPAEIEQAIQHNNYLSSGDLLAVLEGQAGFGQHFLGTTVTKWITKKDGGEIWHGGHKIKFPSGALPQDAQASISINPSNYIQVDFGPDGWFNKAVTVSLSYKNADLTGIDEKSLTIAWYDGATGQWHDVGGSVDTKKKRVNANVWHFTQYTLSTK